MLSAQGQTVGQICRMFGITDQTYYRWRKEYGGLRMNQAKRMKELDELGRVKGSDFEVVETTGPDEGPRAR